MLKLNKKTNLKNWSLKLSAYSSLILTLVSCSSTYRKPESFDDKMNRFTPRNENPNKIVKIKTLPVNFKTINQQSVNRGPASVSPINDKTHKHDLFAQGLSSKRLYFISLYDQYKKMSSYFPTNSAPPINHCPRFHTSVLKYKEKYSQAQASSLSLNTRYHNLNEQSMALYPELNLPISITDESVNVYQAIVNDGLAHAGQLVTQALKVHITKTYKEIDQLCDQGSSQNYYNYENLTTHIKSNGKDFDRSQRSFSNLMKTTLFVNKAIIESLSTATTNSRMPASAISSGPDFFDIVSDKLGAKWSQSYFEAIKKARKN